MERVLLAGLSPPRRRFVLAVVTVVAAAALGVVGWLAVSAVSGRVDPVAQDERGTVLLVPGYGGSTDSLADLATALRSSGRRVVVVALPGDGRGDLGAQASLLDGIARDEAADSDAGSVDVVGYSAGGVVARLWVDEYGGGDFARRVVTLGSPHHGTDLAGLAADVAPDQCPVACVQLAPGSDLLRRLNAEDETPTGPEFVSLWTTSDKTVTPPDSAELNGALNIVLQQACGTGPVSHGELPGNDAAIALVVFELRSAPIVAPTSRDCAPVSS